MSEKRIDILSLNNRKLAVAEIKQINNNIMITSVPKILDKPAFFSKGEKATILSQDEDLIYFYMVEFLSVENNGDGPVFGFRILKHEVIKNIRKESREIVEYQALITDFIKIEYGTILDISASGMKIETRKRILSQFVEVYYDLSFKPSKKRYEVIWEKCVGSIYYYGLQNY